MSTLTIGVDEAQNQLRDLLARVRRGAEVIFAGDDKLVVRLVRAAGRAGFLNELPRKKAIERMNANGRSCARARGMA